MEIVIDSVVGLRRIGCVWDPPCQSPSGWGRDIIICQHRFLHTLNRKVKNKARVEGSICEAYIIEETATFCSHYFEPHVHSRITRLPRNDDRGELLLPSILIFNYPGRPSGACKSHVGVSRLHGQQQTTAL